MTVTESATRVLDNYIGGSWTPAASSDQLDVTNPATGEVLARVPLSSGPTSTRPYRPPAPRCPLGATCR